MWLTKQEDRTDDDTEDLAALVMPLVGHSDEEVERTLLQLDAQVSSLGRGFLSVKATRKALRAVEEIARVELKTIKQMH